MESSRTQNVGKRTLGAGTLQLSRTMVHGKDPKYDYSFRKKDEASQERSGQQGWVPVTKLNSKGEKWGSPVAVHATSNRNSDEIHLEDTMLYKRARPASLFYKQIEDNKYNAQISHVNTAAENIRAPLRRLSQESTVLDEGTKFTQRVGLNDERIDDDIFS